MTEIAQEDIVSVAIFAACLVISALFSAAETAVTSLGVLKTKHLIESRESDANVLKFWLRHPSRVLTTVLIFNTLINALASAIITDMLARHFNSAVGIATGVVTFFVLIFGEIIPKSFARANAEPLAALSIRIVRIFYFLFYPVVVGVSEFANWIIRLMGSKEKFTPTLTEEELEFIINEGTSSGVMEDLKKDMLSGVFEFDETKVMEIMTPRLDVMAIQKNSTIQEALRAVTESGHSRLPVYDDRIDNVIGVLFAKDLLRHVTIKGSTEVKLTTLIREPFFTPESKPIMDVFKDLKRTKNHLSIVIDEYGGMAGIVTMEDILEEIVGEIQDEFDAEEANIVKVGEGVFDVAGTYNIEEFKDYFKLNEVLPDEDLKDVDTVAGWMIQKLGEMPKVGQTLTLAGLSFEVIEVVRHRIAKVRVVQVSEPNDESGASEGY